MSSQILTSFAIAGVGRLGQHVVKALAAVNPQPSIVVLTRQTERNDLPQGVKFATINYEDQSTIIRALQEHKVQALVSVLGVQQIATQYPLVDAAKASGVKLFTPSEYGPPSHGIQDGPALTKAKAELIEYLKSIGLPSTLFYAGSFMENIPLTLALTTGKAHIVGRGETPASFTARTDIGKFVAHALTAFPLSRLEGAIFRIEGQKATLQDIAKIFDKPIEHVETIPAPDSRLSDLFTIIQKEIEAGRSTVFWDWKELRNLDPEEVKNEVAKAVWPEHIWKQIGDPL